MEKKVMLNVLQSIQRGNGSYVSIAPDTTYIDSLISLGFARGGYLVTLTDFGRWQLDKLRNELDQWGT